MPKLSDENRLVGVSSQVSIYFSIHKIDSFIIAYAHFAVIKCWNAFDVLIFGPFDPYLDTSHFADSSSRILLSKCFL